MDHMHHDCILIAVLSHGEMGIVYAKDTPYKPDNLWSLFTADRCPTLAGKKKTPTDRALSKKVCF